MKPPDGGDPLGVRLLGVRRVSDPEQARREPRRIECLQRQASQASYEGLMRELMTTEQIAQALRLILSRGEDCGAHRTVLGFADEHAHEQEREAVKDLGPHQRA
jgi:hypothetical protein